MPELPEVQTVINELSVTLKGIDTRMEILERCVRENENDMYWYWTWW